MFAPDFLFLGISTKNKTEETQPKRGGRYLQQRPTCPWMGKSWDCAPGGCLPLSCLRGCVSSLELRVQVKSCPMQPGSTLQWPLCHDSSSSILGQNSWGNAIQTWYTAFNIHTYIVSSKKRIWYISILIFMSVLILITYYLHISPRIHTYIIYIYVYISYIHHMFVYFCKFLFNPSWPISAPARRALGWSPPPVLAP